MKIFTLVSLLAIGTTAFAQTARKADLKAVPVAKSHFSMYQPTAVTASPYDTLWGNFMTTASPMALTTDNNDFVGGNDHYADTKVGQAFTVTTPYKVVGAIYWFAGKGAGGSTGNAASRILATLYKMDGTGGYTSTANGTATCPGTVMDTVAIPWDQIDTSQTGAYGFYPANFASPVSVSSDYAMGLDYTTLVAGDTTGLVLDTVAASTTTESSWEYASSYGVWVTGKARWGNKMDFAIFPVIDTTSTTTGIQNASYINGVKLFQNSPNPFAGQSIVNYELANNAKSVKLMVIDMTGRLVKTIDEGAQKSGKHSITLNAVDFASGTYFIALQADTHRLAEKMIITH